MSDLEIKVAVVEQTTKTIMEQFADLKKDNIEQHRDLFAAVSEIKSSLDTLPERLDKRYASKETEDALKKVNWIVITSVIISLLALVIKQ